MFVELPFNTLVGKTLTHVDKLDDSEFVLTTSDGDIFALFHQQDCCEWVSIESIVGDLGDLVGSPILVAEEVRSRGLQDSSSVDQKRDYSFSWTFYKLATAKGCVDIRWNGHQGVTLLRLHSLEK